MIQYRNIGYFWQFTEENIESPVKYFYANQLLIQSLLQDCYVSSEVRQEIEDTLLLPIAEIEKHKKRANNYPP